MRLYINIMSIPESEKCIAILNELFSKIRNAVIEFDNNCFIIDSDEVTQTIKDTMANSIKNMFDEVYTVDPRHDDDLKYIIDKLDKDLEVAHNEFHSYLADTEIKYAITDSKGNTKTTADTLSNLLPAEVWVYISDMIDKDILKLTNVIRSSINNLRNKAASIK